MLHPYASRRGHPHPHLVPAGLLAFSSEREEFAEATDDLTCWRRLMGWPGLRVGRCKAGRGAENKEIEGKKEVFLIPQAYDRVALEFLKKIIFFFKVLNVKKFIFKNLKYCLYFFKLTVTFILSCKIWIFLFAAVCGCKASEPTLYHTPSLPACRTADVYAGHRGCPEFALRPV